MLAAFGVAAALVRARRLIDGASAAAVALEIEAGSSDARGSMTAGGAVSMSEPAGSVGVCTREARCAVVGVGVAAVALPIGAEVASTAGAGSVLPVGAGSFVECGSMGAARVSLTTASGACAARACEARRLLAGASVTAGVLSPSAPTEEAGRAFVVGGAAAWAVTRWAGGAGETAGVLAALGGFALAFVRDARGLIAGASAVAVTSVIAAGAGETASRSSVLPLGAGSPVECGSTAAEPASLPALPATCAALGSEARRACAGACAGGLSLLMCERLPVAAAPALEGVTSLRAGERGAPNISDATPLPAASVAGTSARTVGGAASDALSGDGVVGTSADSPCSRGAGGSKSRAAALT